MTDALKMNLVYFTMSDHKKSVISFFFMEGKNQTYVANILHTFSAFFKCL